MNCVRADGRNRAAGRIDRSGRITENDDTASAGALVCTAAPTATSIGCSVSTDGSVAASTAARGRSAG